MTNKDAIKILSVLHLGYSSQVKDACELAIKSLMKEENSETVEELKIVNHEV